MAVLITYLHSRLHPCIVAHTGLFLTPISNQSDDAAVPSLIRKDMYSSRNMMEYPSMVMTVRSMYMAQSFQKPHEKRSPPARASVKQLFRAWEKVAFSHTFLLFLVLFWSKKKTHFRRKSSSLWFILLSKSSILHSRRKHGHACTHHFCFLNQTPLLMQAVEDHMVESNGVVAIPLLKKN